MNCPRPFCDCFWCQVWPRLYWVLIVILMLCVVGSVAVDALYR